MTHSILSINPKSASSAGALDGFEFSCTCGERAGYSILLMTQEASRNHIEYWAKRG